MEIWKTGPGTGHAASILQKPVPPGICRRDNSTDTLKIAFPSVYDILHGGEKLGEGALYQKAQEGYAHYLQPPPGPPRQAHKEAVRYGAAAFEKREYRGMGEHTAGG